MEFRVCAVCCLLGFCSVVWLYVFSPLFLVDGMLAMVMVVVVVVAVLMMLASLMLAFVRRSYLRCWLLAVVVGF